MPEEKSTYTIQVSVEIIDNNSAVVYRYSELVRTGKRHIINVIKTLESAQNIVKIIARDIRKACLLPEGGGE